MTDLVAVAVAAALLAAGVLKLRDATTFAATLRKLSPLVLRRRLSLPRARVVARAVALLEVVVAAGLTFADGSVLRISAAVAVGLGVAFTIVVIAAVRRGASCGCFPSLRSKAAGRVEVVRAVALLVAAVAVVVWPPADRMPLAVRVAALLVAAAIVVSAIPASRLLRGRPKRATPAVPRDPPPISGAVERLRSLPDMQSVEARLAAHGTAIDWSSAQVSAAGPALLISAGRRPGAILTARLGHPGVPLTGTVTAGSVRLSMRAGEVVESTTAVPVRRGDGP